MHIRSYGIGQIFLREEKYGEALAHFQVGSGLRGLRPAALLAVSTSPVARCRLPHPGNTRQAGRCPNVYRALQP